MDKQELLQRLYGYSSFRPGQETLIDGAISGRDVFGILPTGGGKSVCYQIPALMMPGITVVVSPLISLMQDQVMALRTMGIRAAYINSTLNYSQIQLVYRNLRSGRYKILYVAPERLDAERFASLASELCISFVAVDEAHCISQWGQDFRPSYLRIVQFIESLPQRPVVGAFTATATDQVREDIERSLKLQNPVRVITGFDRPNLYFDVLQPKSKDAELERLLSQRKNKSGIVYCATRKNVEAVCSQLRELGFSATRYHAGLEEQERKENQEDFLYDRQTVMVATNAFGMGIDKSNVSFVIHYNMPKSMEAYYQEAGRAGRDGAAAECILLYSASDVITAKFLIENSSDNEDLTEEQREKLRIQDMRRLNQMTAYCKTTVCYRQFILEYFGETNLHSCQNCGNCNRAFAVVDITRQAQMILSCIKRASDHLGYGIGRQLMIQTLRGSGSRRIKELQLDRLSTYGLLRASTLEEVAAMLDVLQEKGYVRVEQMHQTLQLTAEAGDVLFRSKPVSMRVLKTQIKQPQSKAAEEVPQKDEALYEILRELRSKIARESGIPAYVVFSNATLVDMAKKKPTTRSQFKAVSGVGEIKAAWYAEPFLKAIRAASSDGQSGR